MYADCSIYETSDQLAVSVSRASYGGSATDSVEVNGKKLHYKSMLK